MKEEKKTDGICLRSVEYGENDRIITLLTDKLGKVSVRARGVSSPKSRLRHAAIPFSFGEYILTENGDFYTLKSFDYNDAFTAVSDDLVRYFSATAALEIADKLTEEMVSVAGELARLLRFLMSVCYDKGGVPEFLRYFLDMLSIAGYAVSMGTMRPDSDPKYFVFDLEGGGFSSSVLRTPYAVKMTSSSICLLASFLEGTDEEGDPISFAEIFSVLSQYVKVKTGKNLRAVFELCDLLRNGAK